MSKSVYISFIRVSGPDNPMSDPRPLIVAVPYSTRAGPRALIVAVPYSTRAGTKLSLLQFLTVLEQDREL